MSDVDLRTVLNARIATAVGFPATVVLENTSASDGESAVAPVAGTPWARITYRFGSETLRTLPAVGGRLVKTGFTQVDLFVPLLSGTATLDALADAVRTVCPPGLFLTVTGQRLTVLASQRAGGQRDRSWWWDHVDIYWAVRSTNPLAG